MLGRPRRPSPPFSAVAVSQTNHGRQGVDRRAAHQRASQSPESEEQPEKSRWGRTANRKEEACTPFR